VVPRRSLVLVLLASASAIAGTDPAPPADPPVTALREMMRAVNAGEPAAYARLYDETAVIAIHGGGMLNGRKAIEAYEVELMRDFPGTRLAFYDVWRKGSSAVVHYGVNGPLREGRRMGHEGLLFYRFDSAGLIAQELRYLDGFTPMTQLGVFGPIAARPLPRLPSVMRTHAAKGSTTEERNAALVKATFAALDSKDATAFLSGFAQGAVLDDMSEAGPASGRPAVKDWFRRWASAVDGQRTEITSLLAVEDDVLLETVVHGRLRAPFHRLLPSEKEFAVHRAAIVHVQAGRITHMAVFMNNRELADAVSQWPAKVSK
jgi:ketosteroid isomerase-like protein